MSSVPVSDYFHSGYRALHPNRHSQHEHGKHAAEIRNAISAKIKHEHKRLEHMMMNDVKGEMDKIIKFTDDRTKFTYICSILMELYTISLKHRDEFDDRLQHILLHPTQLGDATDAKKKKKSGLMGMLKAPSTEERPRSTSKSYIDSQEIPKQLKKEALKFIAATSPYLDTKILVQEVTAKLTDINEKITNKMTENEIFQTFLSNCAVMTWQMRILNPPLRLCADLDLLFNDDLHLPYRSMKVKDAELDYYLWPVLMEADGTVACKGRVAFKVNT